MKISELLVVAVDPVDLDLGNSPAVRDLIAANMQKMIAQDLFPAEVGDETGGTGKYIGVKLADSSAERLCKWMQHNNIPNPLSIEDLHVTLVLHKTEQFDYEPETYTPEIAVSKKTYSFDLFGENSDSLVLKFVSPELTAKHNELREIYNLPWDFDSYESHVTLSYNAAGVDLNELNTPPFDIILSHEYEEPFNDSWTDDKCNESIELNELKVYQPPEEETLGIPRRQMPQVRSDDYPEFLSYLKDNGASIEVDRVPAASLKPIQKDFSDAGVLKALQLRDREKDVIASSDNYIIDGHHRWLAAVNTKNTIPIIRIDVPVQRLLELVKQFPKTYYKDIYDIKPVEKNTPQ